VTVNLVAYTVNLVAYIVKSRLLSSQAKINSICWRSSK